MSDADHDVPKTSLWTTRAFPQEPLKEANIDRSVSAEEIRQALDAARERAAAFSGEVTEELLREGM